MRVLLDTHTFLWFINDNPALSNRAAELLESEIDLLLSIASLWEIAIKVNLSKLTLPEDYETFIPLQIIMNSIEILPITLEHLMIVAKLPLHHRDPFDRLLVAQAMVEKIDIISADKILDDYGINRQW
jgi:PIN domain nuclease of toxin-antitoxin system